MAVIFVRSLIIYIALLFIMRLMGKRQIGEMQPFEFIVAMLISELACIPMSDVSIPLLYGVSAILAVFVLHQFVSLIEKSGNFLKFLISGKPSIVINKSGVDFKELRKNNLDVSDLIESMRTLGHFSLDSVEFAIYEANGTLSAIEKENVSQPQNLPMAVIKNGKTDKTVLKKLNVSESELESQLSKLGCKKIKNVGILTIDNSGRYYLQEFNKNFQVGNVALSKEIKW